MISLATETERTLFFDFLPLALGQIRGFKTRFHLYTVPGQVFYDASRKLILKGVDGVVFVADSQIERMEANLESLDNLKLNLAEQGYELDKTPYIVQYNKRDLPNAAPLDEIRKLLNPTGMPDFEACATVGTGVFETLKAVARAGAERPQADEQVGAPNAPPGDPSILQIRQSGSVTMRACPTPSSALARSTTNSTESTPEFR